MICLVLAAFGIEWRQVGVVFRQAVWWRFAPALAFLCAYLVARSVRWRILLGPNVPLVDVFSITNIGYLVSNVLPFRLGDPARAVAIGLRGLAKTSAALSTVVVERVLDMAMVVLLLAVSLLFVGEAGWTRGAGIAGGSTAAAALILLILAAAHPEWARSMFGWLAGRFSFFNSERWRGILEGLLDGLAALRSWRKLVALALWTFLTWICTVGMYLFLMGAFMERPTLVQATFLTCVLGLGVAVPSSPGAVGVFHSVARYALELPFGLAKETAFAIAFASHAFVYVVMCILGLVGLLHQNLSLQRIQSGLTATSTKE